MARMLVFDLVYPHPPAAVWTAITSAEEIARRLMPNGFEPRDGHKLQLRSKPMPGLG